jgi:glycosyltransferase involved in cell wall biosynthesis
MKIAQVAPLIESVPPKGYGGTERVVSYITEELVRLGHDVTLFASGDSVTRAKLVSPVARGLRLENQQDFASLYHTIMVDQVFKMAASFDVIHFHIDYFHLPLACRSKTPYLTTMHGRLDVPSLPPLFRHFPNAPLVSISQSQRAPLPWANWRATVHHGLPTDLYSFHSGPGEYFAFVGRMSSEKRVDRAIEIAEHCGVPIYIAAKIDKTEEAYFNEYLKPLFRSRYVNYVGEIGEMEKNEFLGRAKALLFPIDWPEPFGLVQIESFACGTPVVAYKAGSVPEVMAHGVTGFIVENQKEAFEAASRVESIDRGRCREVFEKRFTAERMATDYLRAYEAEIFKEQDLQLAGEANG